MYHSSCCHCVLIVYWCSFLFLLMRLACFQSLYFSILTYYCNLPRNTFWELHPTLQARQSFAHLSKTNFPENYFLHNFLQQYCFPCHTLLGFLSYFFLWATFGRPPIIQIRHDVGSCLRSYHSV